MREVAVEVERNIYFAKCERLAARAPGYTRFTDELMQLYTEVQSKTYGSCLFTADCLMALRPIGSRYFERPNDRRIALAVIGSLANHAKIAIPEGYFPPETPRRGAATMKDAAVPAPKCKWYDLPVAAFL
jgi:hypothetical protein